MADNQFGISVGIDASAAATGASTFQRSAETVAASGEKIAASLDKAKKGVKETGDAMGGFGEGLNEIAEKITGFNVAALATAGAIGALAAVLTEAITGASETEAAFIRLQNATAQTDAQFAETKENLEALSNQFGNTRAEEAGAAAQIAARGFDDAAQSAKILAEANKLALSSGQSLTDSTGLLSKALQLFKADASEAGKYAADLNTLMVQAQIAPAQLTQEFTRLGPSMVKAGISMDEFTKAVLDTKQAGLDGRQGLQAMRAIVEAISGDSPKAAEAFTAFSGSLQDAGFKAKTFKELVSESGGITEALKALQVATHGNQAEFEAMIGGSAALTGALALTGQTAAQSAKSQKELGDASKNYDTDAKRAADSTEHLAKIAKNDFGAALDDLGTQVLPVVNEVLKTMSGLVKDLAMYYGGLAHGVKAVAEGAASLVKNIIPASWQTEVQELNAKFKTLVGLKAEATKPAEDLTDFTPTAHDKIEPQKTDASVLDTKTKEIITKQGLQQSEAATAQTDLNKLRGASVSQLKEMGLSTQQAAELEGQLTAQIIAANDALTANARAWDKVATANDPVAKAANDAEEALRKLNEAAAKAGVGHNDPTYLAALTQENEKAKEANVLANEKVSSYTAASDAQKNLSKAIAEETNRESEAALALQGHADAQERLAAIQEDGTLKVEKALIATEALTKTQLAAAQANLALGEAQAKANDQKLTGDARARFLQEYKLAALEAAAATEEFQAKIDSFVGSYNPLLKVQEDYRKQLVQLAALEETANPAQRAQLQAGLPVLAAQHQQQVDNTLPLGKTDASQVKGVDDYSVAVAKLNEAFEAGNISEREYNQGLAEQQQGLLVAESQFNGYAEAVIQGGKAMDSALTNLLDGLGRRGTTLRGIFEGLSKQLQESAAKIVAQKLESSATSALSNSTTPAIANFGKLLNKGTGSQLQGAGGSDVVKNQASLTTNTSAISTLTAAVNANTQAHGGAPGGAQAAAGGSAADVDLNSGNLSAANLDLGVGNSSVAAGTTTAAGTSAGGVSQGQEIGGATALANDVAAGGKDEGGKIASSAVSTFAPQIISGIKSAGSSIGGFFSSLLSSGAGAALAGGGDAKAGSTHMVGEHGPEMVTFGGDAHVSSNADTRAALSSAAGNKAATIVQPPQVNVPVQVVNVSDPKQVPTAMQGPDGSKAILNVLSQNRSAVNSLLGN